MLPDILSSLEDQQNFQALRIHLSLDPQQSLDPSCEPNEDDSVYARKLFKLITNNITSDPDFIQRLRDHYYIV